jgi:predicted DCC family thiol-disulfide oxidoreductase YuxK
VGVTPKSAPVLLFDGKCNFCDAAVHFVLDHEVGSDIRFAPLQSDVALELLTEAGGSALAAELHAGATDAGDPTSLVLLDEGKVYTHSTGALKLTRYLAWPWSWMRVFLVVPRPIRDIFYRWFAKNRYRWFGKTDACRVPTPDLRARFLA